MKKLKPENIGMHLLKYNPKVLFQLFPNKTGKQILKIIKLNANIKKLK